MQDPMAQRSASRFEDLGSTTRTEIREKLYGEPPMNRLVDDSRVNLDLFGTVWGVSEISSRTMVRVSWLQADP